MGLKKELEKLKNKSNSGGVREGAGRPLGGKNKATIEQKAVLERWKKRVADEMACFLSLALLL